MFNKELRQEVEELRKELQLMRKDIPDIKVCHVCNTVRPKSHFFDPDWRSGMWAPPYLDHCRDCHESVKLKERAIEAARKNPEQVLKCLKKVKKP